MALLRPIGSVVLALTCALLAPTVAGAATASTVPNGTGNEVDVRYDAALGEQNVVTVSTPAPDVYAITDSGGVALSAGTGCTKPTATELRCTAANLHAIVVDLGDGDDEFTNASAAPVQVGGGDGNDVLVGGPGFDAFGGQAGDDTLDGGAGPDWLSGGDGRDVVTYAGRSAAVTVTPGGYWDDGEANEHDSLTADVEEILGGAGDDNLTGGAIAETLRGGPGADHLVGGDGDDVLRGDSGDDALDGGLGADDLDAGAGLDSADGGDGDDAFAMRDDAADTVTCGAGSDQVTADRDDALDACETVDLPPLPDPPPAPAPAPAGIADALPVDTPGGTVAALPFPVTVLDRVLAMGARGRRLPIRLHCSSDDGSPCTGTIVVRVKLPSAKRAVASRRGRKAKLASARYKISAGKDGRVLARVSRRGVTQSLKGVRATARSGRREGVKVKATMAISMRVGGTTRKLSRAVTVTIPRSALAG